MSISSAPVDRTDLVSIIVTTRNSENTLEECLLSLKRQTYTQTETIVVDNFSADGSEEIASRLASKFAKGGPERSAQRNLGARMASGDFLLFVDADMKLTPKVVADCINRVGSFDALVIPENSVGTNWLAKIRSIERKGYLQSLIFEAARFLRKETFESLGGYDTSLTGLEDYDIQARLEEYGYCVGYVTEPILHCEENLSLGQLLRKRAYYAQSLARYTEVHPLRAAKQFGIRRVLFYLCTFRRSPRALLAVLSLKFLEYLVFRFTSAWSRVRIVRAPY